MSRTVAVIDIGSNSIKLLVARRAPDGTVVPLLTELEETRISRGISAAKPFLSEEGMKAGVEAVSRLASLAAAHGPEKTVLVATSAVRDAGNGADFQSRIAEATGLSIRILSGEEEAQMIGLGLLADPSLSDVSDFLVFDLGGGSLECLEFQGKRLARAVSLQLGCVRLTERCVADADGPFTAADQAAVEAEVEREFAAHFPIAKEKGIRVVATGGSMETARAILAKRDGSGFSERNPVLSTAEIAATLALASAVPLERRREIAGLPASRADVICAALTTLLTVARMAGASSLTYSESNLRYGLAHSMLGE